MAQKARVQLATLCYVRKNGKTLMLHRLKKENDYHYGKWNGLGGKVESGETPEECAVREVKEESGLIVDHLMWKGLLTFPLFDGKKDWYVFVYVVDQFHGELIDSPEGHLEWITNEELSALNLWPGDRIFLPWLDKKGIFSARFDYRNGDLEDYQVHFYQS